MTDDLQNVLRQSKDRLFPSFRDPNYLVLSKRRRLFRNWLARIGQPALHVLDVGGRLQPYRALLQERVARYVAVDVRKTPLVNVIARGEMLPLAGESFDLVICTQVLQYIGKPLELLREVHRVLRPGRHLLLSTSAAEPLAGDIDFWRFTPASLSWLLQDFSAVEVVPEGNSVIGFFRSANVYLNMFAKFRVLRKALSFTSTPLLNAMGLLAEKLSGSANHQFSVNYSVLAQK